MERSASPPAERSCALSAHLNPGFVSRLVVHHRLHGVSHDGNDDVPNPFLPTVGAADVNLAYTMRYESAYSEYHGRALRFRSLHQNLSRQFRFFHGIPVGGEFLPPPEEEAYNLTVRAHGFRPCTDLHYALRRLAYRAGIAKITAAAFELLSLALIANILDVVGVARFSTAHHRQHPNLASYSGGFVGGFPEHFDEDYDDESSISETSEESGNEDSDESEDEDEEDEEDEEEWREEVQQWRVTAKGTYIRASDIVAAAARSTANLKQPLFL